MNKQPQVLLEMQRKQKVPLMRQTFGDLAGLVKKAVLPFCRFCHHQQGWCYGMCLVGVDAEVSDQGGRI